MEDKKPKKCEKSQFCQLLHLANGVALPSLGVNLKQCQKENQKAILDAASNVTGCHHFCITSKLEPTERSHALWEWIDESQISRDQLFISVRMELDCSPGCFNDETVKTISDRMGRDGMEKVDLLLISIKSKKNAIGADKKKTAGSPASIVLEMDKGDGAVKPKLEKPLAPFECFLQRVWPSLERLYADGAFRAIGVCGLKVDQFEELWRRAAVKPHCWQVDLSYLMENFNKIKEVAVRLGLVLFVSTESGISGVYRTNGGAQQPGTFFLNVLRDVARKCGKTATQVLYRWLHQHGFALLCSGTINPKRLTEQMDIAHFRISPEDMNRLNGLHNRHSLPSPYK